MNEQNEIQGDLREVERFDDCPTCDKGRNLRGFCLGDCDEREDAYANMPEEITLTEVEMEDWFLHSVDALKKEIHDKPTFPEHEMYDDYEPTPDDEGDWR